jgi:hypothetical protein
VPGHAVSMPRRREEGKWAWAKATCRRCIPTAVPNCCDHLLLSFRRLIVKLYDEFLDIRAFPESPKVGNSVRVFVRDRLSQFR